jgi:hypothetical protein
MPRGGGTRRFFIDVCLKAVGFRIRPAITSVLRTAEQRGLDTTGVLAAALQAPRAVVLDAFQSAPLY